MSKQSKIAFGVAAGIIILTALALNRLQAWQRLGTPGVKVVPKNVYREDGVQIGSNSIALPARVLNFDSSEQPILKVVSDWLPKDTVYAQRYYHSPDGFGNNVNVVLMGTDRTSIHDPKYCLTGQGWRITKMEKDHVTITEPHPYTLPVVRMTILREAKEADGSQTLYGGVFVFWFVADGQITADHKQRMWWMARDLVAKGVLQRWAYVACAAVCAPGQEDNAYARVREWIAAAVPHFQLTTGQAVSLAKGM